MPTAEPTRAEVMGGPTTRGERACLVALLQHTLSGPDRDPDDAAGAILDHGWRRGPDHRAGVIAELEPSTRVYVTLLAEHEPCTCSRFRCTYSCTLSSVVLGELDAATADQVDQLLLSANVFDALAAHVVYVARQRGWSALAADPGRLQRVNPDVDDDLL